jgi:hypothetical protein
MKYRTTSTILYGVLIIRNIERRTCLSPIDRVLEKLLSTWKVVLSIKEDTFEKLVVAEDIPSI